MCIRLVCVQLKKKNSKLWEEQPNKGYLAAFLIAKTEL